MISVMRHVFLYGILYEGIFIQSLMDEWLGWVSQGHEPVSDDRVVRMVVVGT